MTNDLIVPKQRKYDLKDGTARRCFVTSPKSANGPFWLQSLAMALYVRERDIDPNTAWIRSEPGFISFPFEGKVIRYWPDFEVGYADHTASVTEIKSAARRNDEKMLAKFREVRRVCEQAERRFELIFSDRLYREPKRRNVGLIHYYKDTPVSESDLRRVLHCLDSEAEMKIADLVKACPDVTSQKLYALVAKGHLWLNLFKPIDGTALIRRRRDPLRAMAA